jgi:hypothetical protein
MRWKEVWRERGIRIGVMEWESGSGGEEEREKEGGELEGGELLVCGEGDAGEVVCEE